MAGLAYLNSDNINETPVSAANPLPVVMGGASGAAFAASNFTPAQVSVGATATLIVAARTGRISVTIVNTTTTPIYVGGSGVTTSTGQLLPGVVGASMTVNANVALYGIVATGSATVTEAELY